MTIKISQDGKTAYRIQPNGEWRKLDSAESVAIHAQVKEQKERNAEINSTTDPHVHVMPEFSKPSEPNKL